MCVAILPCENGSPPHVGQAEVSFGLDGAGRTCLTKLYQSNPLRVILPRPEPQEPSTAVLVTTSGGLVGGDRLRVKAVCDPETRVLITAQAAEKVYRSAGNDVIIDVHLEAHPGAHLEWLPQETILFEEARLRRTTHLTLYPEGEILASEMSVFGRLAMGESLTRGLVRDAWRITDPDGKQLWTDALHLEGEIAEILNHPAGLDGAVMVATVIHAGGEQNHLGVLRALLEPLEGPAVRVAAGQIDQIITVVRWLGRDACALRNAFGAFWSTYRHEIWQRPRRLPRLWHI